MTAISEGRVALTRSFNGPGVRVHVQGERMGFVTLTCAPAVALDDGTDFVQVNDTAPKENTVRITVGSAPHALVHAVSSSTSTVVAHNLAVCPGEEIWIAVSNPRQCTFLVYGHVTQRPTT